MGSQMSLHPYEGASRRQGPSLQGTILGTMWNRIITLEKSPPRARSHLKVTEIKDYAGLS